MTDKKISTIVEDLFPSFYKEEGQSFIQFVKAYYEWMEQQDNVDSHLRQLPNYFDIDKTIDEFIAHFKEQYLPDVDFAPQTDRRMMIKHAKEFVSSKGSEEGIKLLFRLIYGEEAEIFRPSEKILRPSDGTWFVPRYLELNSALKTKEFVGKNIIGSASGATALAERLSTKIINGKKIDVLYVSNVKGNFVLNELITSDGDLTDSPKVIGSLTTIDVNNVGKDFVVGDVVTIESSLSGRGGKAKITATGDATGRVLFNLINGGYGFSNTATVYVSEQVLNLSAKTPDPTPNWPYTDFLALELVEQPLENINCLSMSAALTVNTHVYGYDSGTRVAEGYVVAVPVEYNANTEEQSVRVITYDGSFTLASDIGTAGNTIAGIIDTTTDATATGIVVGTTNAAIGIAQITNQFTSESSFAYIKGQLSNTYANVASISTGSGADFDVGRLADTEKVYLNTDRLLANNVGGVPFYTMKLNGENANIGFVDSVTVIDGGTGYTNNQPVSFVGGTPTSEASGFITTDNAGVVVTIELSSSGSGYDTKPTAVIEGAHTGSTANLSVVMDYGYGFSKDPNGDLTTVLNNVLTRNVYTIGTIADLTNINLGKNYNQDPFVLVIEPGIAGFNRRDIVIGHDGEFDNFVVGEMITQSFSNTETIISYLDKNAYDFEFGEVVSQGTSQGIVTEVTSSGSTTGAIRVRPSTGMFQANSTPIIGSTTTAQATIDVVSETAVLSSAKGVVKSVSPGYITVRRKTFNTSFEEDLPIEGSVSGYQAYVTSLGVDDASRPIGFNANITAAAGVANGVIESIDVIDSGFAYKQNELVTLIKEGSPYIATGYVNLVNQGEAEGYFTTEKGFLNSNYLHDNDYWQEYSYEVRTGIALSRYADILKRVAHVAGSKMFGSVVKTVYVGPNISAEGNAAVTSGDAILTVEGGNGIKFSNSEYIRMGSNTVGFSNGGVSTSLSIPGYVNLITNQQVFMPTIAGANLTIDITKFSYDDTTDSTVVVANNVSGYFINGNTQAQAYSNTYVITVASTNGLSNGDVVIQASANLVANLASMSNAYVTNTRSGIASYRAANGMLVTTTGSNKIRPRYAANGMYIGLLLEESRTNAVLRSEELDNAYWTNTNCTIVANDIYGPANLQTADKIVATATNGNHGVQRGSLNVVADKPYTWSCFFKASEYGFAQVALSPSSFGGVSPSAIVNLSNGAVTSTSNNTSSVWVEKFIDNWYRFGITATATANGTCTAYARIASDGETVSFAGDGSSGLHATGLQFEMGDTMTSYIGTTATSLTREADNMNYANTGWNNQAKASGRIVKIANNKVAIVPAAELYIHRSANYPIEQGMTIVQKENGYVAASGEVLFSNTTHIIATVDKGTFSKRYISASVANVEVIRYTANTSTTLVVGETVTQTINANVVATGTLRSVNATHAVVASLNGSFVTSNTTQTTWLTGVSTNAKLRVAYSNTIVASVVNSVSRHTSFNSNAHLYAHDAGSAQIANTSHNANSHFDVITFNANAINTIRVSDYTGGVPVGATITGNTTTAIADVIAITR